MKKLFFLISLTLLFFVGESMSMPSFARRYNLECTDCHAPIPRLNEFGFKFRAAGYRLPSDIGQTETPTKMSDFWNFRQQFSLISAHNTDAAGNTKSTTHGNFKEITFYPITFSFAKNWSSIVELSMAPDEGAEIENAYLRYNFGQEDAFYSVRVGIFHPFEGYGASDRPASLSRPLMQGLKANNGTQNPFKAWGYDQFGINFQAHLNNTSVSLTVFNGLNANGEPDKGGPLLKQYGNPSYNSKDFQVMVTQVLTDNGGGISAEVYHGSVDLPTATNIYQDNYNRFSLYASYPVVENSLLLAGYGYGTDNTDVAVGGEFKSSGYFGEFDYGVNDNLWVGVRYDAADPSTDISDNGLTAITAFANIPLNNGIQFIAQYQNKTTQTPAGNITDNVFQIRGILIW